MTGTRAFMLAAVLLPATASAQPPSTTTEVYDAWNAPVFATGALVFVGSFGGSAIVAARSDNPAAERLYIPIVGPWLALDHWGACPIDEARCDKTTTDKLLLVADGVFQAAGVITMVSGVLSPSLRKAPAAAGTRTDAATKLSIVPTRNGFAVRGAF